MGTCAQRWLLQCTYQSLLYTSSEELITISVKWSTLRNQVPKLVSYIIFLTRPIGLCRRGEKRGSGKFQQNFSGRRRCCAGCVIVSKVTGVTDDGMVACCNGRGHDRQLQAYAKLRSLSFSPPRESNFRRHFAIAFESFDLACKLRAAWGEHHILFLSWCCLILRLFGSVKEI